MTDAFFSLIQRMESRTIALVIRMIARWTIAGALCLAVAGGPLLLQPLAWGSMVIQYARAMPLREAVAKTFDGDHPCDLCKSIAAVHQSKKKEEARFSPVRPDLFCAKRAITFQPGSIDLAFFTADIRATDRDHSPPTPPPRSSAV